MVRTEGSLQVLGPADAVPFVADGAAGLVDVDWRFFALDYQLADQRREVVCETHSAALAWLYMFMIVVSLPASLEFSLVMPAALSSARRCW